jgi:SAM-dependent methyltransferase
VTDPAGVSSTAPDLDQVGRATAEYYDRRVVLADAWDSEPVEALPDPRPELARMREALRRVVRGRRALELGCGTGVYTRVAATAATSILALDSSERAIAEASASSPGGHVEFRVEDAFVLDQVPAAFTAGFACGVFHLVPYARHAAFLDALHSRLRPGATVFLGATHTRTHRARRRALQVDGCPDTFSSRTLSDGSTYVIVNNEFDEPRLRAIFAPAARDLEVTTGEAWWWVTYRL